MKEPLKSITEFILRHASDMDNGNYECIMREIAEWANGQADVAEYLDEIGKNPPFDE